MLVSVRQDHFFYFLAEKLICFFAEKLMYVQLERERERERERENLKTYIYINKLVS